MARINPEVSSTPLSPPDTKKALTELQPNIERDMLGSSLSLTLASSARASRSAVQIRSRRICRTRRFRPHLSLRQIRQRPRLGPLSYLAEREGFEPSIELLTLYSLSRGAPSTTRPSLRILAPQTGGSRVRLIRRDAKDTRRATPGKAQESAAPPASSDPGPCSRLMR